MKRAALLAIATAVACGSGGGGSKISGMWVGQIPVAIVEVDLDLAEQGGVISGTGQYYIDGPRPTGTLVVRGSFSDPAVALLIAFDTGSTGMFEGELETASLIVGTYSDSSRFSQQLILNRVRGAVAQAAETGLSH